MAGAANAILASPGTIIIVIVQLMSADAIFLVEMFKVRMQGQYGAATDKRLREVVRDMWKQWGFRQGIMRGYWVSVVLHDM